MPLNKWMGESRRRHRRWGAAMLFAALLLWVSPASGRVLKGPHILELMVGKLAGAQTLQVDQQVIVEDPDISAAPVQLDETLLYILPDRVRSDIRFEDSHRIHVLAQGQTLTVVDEVIASGYVGNFDRYTDLILKNSRIAMHKALLTHGVDVGITSLGQMQDRIVYVIGAKYPDTSVSQLWVDKDRLLPLRWILVTLSKDGESEHERLEFVYRNWQNLDGVWYPMEIETIHNHQSVRRIQVKKVQANTVIAAELLNIEHLRTLYKEQESEFPEDETPESDVDEVERAIEEFKKKFDP